MAKKKSDAAKLAAERMLALVAELQAERPETTTQEEIALLMGLIPSHISQIKLRESVGIEAVARVCKTLKIRADYFLDRWPAGESRSYKKYLRSATGSGSGEGPTPLLIALLCRRAGIGDDERKTLEYLAGPNSPAASLDELSAMFEAWRSANTPAHRKAGSSKR